MGRRGPIGLLGSQRFRNGENADGARDDHGETDRAAVESDGIFRDSKVRGEIGVSAHRSCDDGKCTDSCKYPVPESFLQEIHMISSSVLILQK